MASQLNYKNIISIFLLTAVAVYAAFFLYKPGFVGYANNYDFIRHSACFGLWSYIPDQEKTAGHPSEPSSQLLYDGELIENACIKSSDNIFSYAVTAFISAGDIVSFTKLSSFKIIALIALSFLAISASKSKLVPSIILFSILTEWIYLAYANTLYAEFSVVSAFTLIVICSYNLIHEKKNKYSIIQIVLLLIAIIWLGLSKQQWSYLTFILLCVASWVIFHRTAFKKTSFILVLISVASIIVFHAINKQSFKSESIINSANKVNTFFHAVLPEATDKLHALQTLGLPEQCYSDIGKSWYHPEQNALNNCPEIQTISRAKLFNLFMQDPATLIMPVVNFANEMKPFYPAYLGITIADDVNSQKKLDSIKKLSLSHIVNTIHSSIFFIIALALFSISFLSGILLLLLPNKFSITLTSYLYLLTTGGLTTGYSIVSSVFGDGYIEAAKHAVLFLAGVYIQSIAILCIFIWIAHSVLKKHKFIK